MAEGFLSRSGFEKTADRCAQAVLPLGTRTDSCLSVAYDIVKTGAGGGENRTRTGEFFSPPHPGGSGLTTAYAVGVHVGS